jgi:hypothetical protein
MITAPKTSKSYTLITGEYMGTKEFKFLIRAELRPQGEGKNTLFLLGIPNPLTYYALAADKSEIEARTELYRVANEAIGEYLGSTDWTEGNIYYGELREDATFDISDEKPDWEDGNWGTKI